jgi:uncharacterized protein
MLTLSVLPDHYAVCRMGLKSPFPMWAAGDFISVTRTQDEVSVVCRENSVPANDASVQRMEGGWRILKLHGPFDFAETGILAQVLNPLAAAQIPIFAVSTFDTDYVMVKEQHLSHAVDVLRLEGHNITRD